MQDTIFKERIDIMSYTQQQFFDIMKIYCINDMKKSGILASLTAAQGLIESNKGNSGLTVKANNLFGIKGKYKGQSVKMWTTEYYNGVKTRIQADFRKYPSWQESVNDHSDLFNRMPRYENLRNCQDYEEACINVKKDGYATSPTYTKTLMLQIQKNKLWQWDYLVIKDYPVNKLRTVKLGSDGGGVYLLQKLMIDKGYKLNPDSNFGQVTEQCVKAYQQANNLVVDGMVGPKTWQKLKEA